MGGQEGLAALEKARGETAALRHLANAARMINGNPSLMSLRLTREPAQFATRSATGRRQLAQELLPAVHGGGDLPQRRTALADTWHVPLHDRAHRVHISKDYLIYRQCSIALTHRGRAQPLATRFVDFLRSPEGAQIFESWEWMTTAPDSGPVVVHDVICAVCRITHDEWQDNTGLGLALIKTLLEDYRAMGVASAAIRISAVFQGPAAYWLLKDDAYRTHTRRKGANPNMELIRELTRKGVSIELCAKTMKQYGWSEDDILPEVKIVPGAYQRIIDLELQGYAYLCF